MSEEELKVSRHINCFYYLKMQNGAIAELKMDFPMDWEDDEHLKSQIEVIRKNWEEGSIHNGRY